MLMIWLKLINFMKIYYLNIFLIKRYVDAPKGYELSKKENIVKEVQCSIKEIIYDNWMKFSLSSFDLEQSQYLNAK